MVLQAMTDRLIEVGKRYGMETNVEKIQVMRIPRQPSPGHITMDKKQMENVQYFTYLGSLIKNDERCKHEITSRISIAKVAFNKKETYHQQNGLKFKEQISEMLHLEHSFVWC
jgi:hypothetical protein